MQHLPFEQKVEKQRNRVGNENLTNTLISAAMKEIVRVGGTVIESFKGFLF